MFEVEGKIIEMLDSSVIKKYKINPKGKRFITSEGDIKQRFVIQLSKDNQYSKHLLLTHFTYSPLIEINRKVRVKVVARSDNYKGKWYSMLQVL